MMDDPDRLVQRLIDGELSDDEAAAALHRIADAPEARRLLQLEHRLHSAFDQTPEPAIPASFTEDTLAAFESAQADEASVETKEPQLSTGRQMQAVLDRIVQRLSGSLRVAVAVLGLCIITFAAGRYSQSLWTSTNDPSGTTAVPTEAVHQTNQGEGSVQVWARFIYPNDEATSVAVAGDFNGWEPQPLTPRTHEDGRTVWTAVIPMARGEHEYMYVIDGDEWVTDPYAPEQRDDGYGAQNAVLNL